MDIEEKYTARMSWKSSRIFHSSLESLYLLNEVASGLAMSFWIDYYTY
jgi:hypothetical protein